MIKKFSKIKGFTLIEVVVYISILSFVVLIITSYIFWMNFSEMRTRAQRETFENARSAIDTMTYEIRGANSIYAPTTAQSQLSLETTKYLPTGENITYIDFFLCGTRLCEKKEKDQDSTYITSDSVQVSNLQFTPVVTNNYSSVKISLTVSEQTTSITLSSSAALRIY